MNTNEFDKLLQEKFGQQEFPYNPASWERLSGELPRAIPMRSPHWLRNIAAAASVLLVVGAAAWVYLRDNSDAQPVAEVQTAVKTDRIVGSGTPPGPPATEASSALPSSQTPNTVAKASRKKQPNHTVAVQKEQDPIPQSSFPEVPKYQTVVTENEEPVAVKKEKDKPYIGRDIAHDFEPVQHKKQPNTNLSIAGGLNYGSLNTGYTAGINARQRIGNKVYVEGDLSIVSNQVSQANLTSEQFDAFTASASSRPEQVNPSSSNFLYLQFNPSVGYQVLNNLSLSVGADMQRLLNNMDNNHRLIFVGDEVKFIPELDLGLTGKTEYAVSPRLKAGLLYREGINSLVQGNNDYLERRYVQVQLKYIVFGK